MKRIATYILFMLVSLSPAQTLTAAVATQQNKVESARENDVKAPALTVSNDTIQIHGATPGATMEIYNILGVKISSTTIDSSEKTIALNLQKGYYIVKLENIVRKIVIR